MEMIAFSHDLPHGVRLAAINTLFKTLGLCIPSGREGAAAIEILYGRDPAGTAGFSIIVPKISKGSSMSLPYDLTYIRSDREIRFVSDIFFIYSQMISGNLETEVMHQEIARKKELAAAPFIDLAGKALFNALREACSVLEIPLVIKSFWPKEAEFAVCLTHDVDEVRKTYQWITYPARCIWQRSLKRLRNQGISFFQKLAGTEPYWTFETLMKAEKIRGVRSTFFFLQETGKVHFSDIRTWRHAGRRYRFENPKISSLIHTMHEGGWEVGLHGSFYSYNNAELIKKEKEDLEAVLGTLIAGTRQHNLNLAIPATWQIQEKAGLVYDTTLGFNDCLGFRWGTCFPFRYYLSQEAKELSILEIPLVIEDTAYFRYKAPWEEFLRVAGQVENVHGILTLLWHHSVFNDAEFPGWQQGYEQMCDYCRSRNAWITSGHKIAEWWLQREQVQFKTHFENNILTIEPGAGTECCLLTVFLPKKKGISRCSGMEKTSEGEGYIKIRTHSNSTESLIEFQ